MKDILSTIGSCTIAILLIYIIKKIDGYIPERGKENKNYKIDRDDDDEL